MRYRYIFWDFNGTVIDDVNNALACVNDLLNQKGRQPITLKEYYNYVETPIVGFYRHILPPEEIDFDVISKGYHESYARRIDETQLAEGVYELMHSLKEQGAHQYIITANHIDEVMQLLKKYGIDTCVDGVTGATNTKAESKTQRAKELFSSLNMSREDALFIGDTLHDAETANAMGIDCVLVEYGHQGKKLLRKQNVFTVASIKEIENIIRDGRTVDFHTHSSCSDGTLTPSELVRHAEKSGLSAFALTDHDSVDGIKEAVAEAQNRNIEFIPGIEFSAADKTETHIIGLFINPENETLLSTIKNLKNSRERRMKDICSKLCGLGFDITYEEALKTAKGHFVGRAHIAKLMVEKGFCETVKECFDKYIGLGKPAYSEKHELTAVQAVKAIKSAGGLAFLAHLNQTGYDLNELRELLSVLKEAGLDGIEGYYPEYTAEQISDYRSLALELGLALSGGSDYHADMKPHIQIGVGTGNLKIPYYILENLKNISETQRNKSDLLL